jgi:hypothetical protein
MDLSRLEFVVTAEGTVFDIDGRMDGLRVARAVCVRTGDRLLLGDISLEQDVSPPWPILHRRRPRQLERRGIGTALLKRLLQEAEAAGISEIKGSVTLDAIVTQPWLLSWYKKHGFEVTEADAGSLRGSKKMVVWRRKLQGTSLACDRTN